MEPLKLVISNTTFNDIKSGKNSEIIININSHWIKRLCSCVGNHDANYPHVNCKENDCMKCFHDAGENWTAYPFEFVSLFNPKTREIMIVNINDIYVNEIDNKRVFIIKFGDKL